MNKQEPSFDSIIFDLDGTLWDAVELYAQSWNKCFKSHHINQSVDKIFLSQLMGLEEKVYLSKVLPGIAEDGQIALYEEVVNTQYDLISKSEGLIYDGVADGLSRLSHKYKLFIVSNCPEFTIKYFMKRYVIGGYILDTVSHGENFKPKHENIKGIIEKHQLLKPVYVGDTESDRTQCNMAGIPFIFMEYGFGFCQDYLFKYSSFEEFTNSML